jgi:3-dehydroquinate synthase
MMKNNTPYPVYFDSISEHLDTFLSEREFSKIVILTDTNTSEKCLPNLSMSIDRIANCDIIEIDAGEGSKNTDICTGIWSMMNDFHMDRHSLLVNLGGGMVCDIGGFAASTYMRGISFIHIPTSLLAMVDASIGGKNAVDLNSLKNMIGTFAQPEAVFIAPEFLDTLPERERLSGYAEILKHGLISDAAYWETALGHMGMGNKAMLPIIQQSVEIKSRIVADDPEEAGPRKLLNFGHTVGHAIESFSLSNDANPLLHGEAIAIGMICEAYLSFKKNKLPETQLHKITMMLLDHYPVYAFGEEDFDSLIGLMRKDKKNKKNLFFFTLLQDIGKADYNIECREDELIEALHFYRRISGVEKEPDTL